MAKCTSGRAGSDGAAVFAAGVSGAAFYKDIERLLEDVLWNYELVNLLVVLRAALDSNRFY